MNKKDSSQGCLNTLQMEIGLMNHFEVSNLVVTCVRHAIPTLHECDILMLSNANYATEIEIKVSKQDLIADQKKGHGHFHNHIARLFYAVPTHLVEISLQIIPARAGLYKVVKCRYGYGFVCSLIRSAKRNKDCIQWSDGERGRLAHLGAARNFGLKRKIAYLQGDIDKY